MILTTEFVEKTVPTEAQIYEISEVIENAVLDYFGDRTPEVTEIMAVLSSFIMLYQAVSRTFQNTTSPALELLNHIHLSSAARAIQDLISEAKVPAHFSVYKN